MKRDRTVEAGSSKTIRNGNLSITMNYDIKNCRIIRIKHEANKIIKQILRDERLMDKKLRKKLTNRQS